MRYLKTKRCVVCGKTAEMWHGYVIAKDKMALGNYVDKKSLQAFVMNMQNHLLLIAVDIMDVMIQS